MKPEDKELLIRDLCARLPYHCRVFYEYVDNLDNKTYGYSLTLNTWCINEFDADKAVVKPYLRPMSSMTEEEKEQIRDFWIDADVKTHATQLIDFYNKYHFDYRGLIEKGLALEAPSGMY